MSTVTIGVSSLDDTKGRMRRAFRGEKQGAFIGFASLELLWKVLTPKRWEIVRVLTGAGPLAIREVARRVDRDVKSVHGDVQALLKAGVLDRADDGRIIFPYDEIHVDFVVRAAQQPADDDCADGAAALGAGRSPTKPQTPSRSPRRSRTKVRAGKGRRRGLGHRVPRGSNQLRRSANTMTRSEMRSITDIPEALIRSCVERHRHFTVGFVRIERSKRSEDAVLLGSGVLVRVGHVRAILTAAHVLDVLPRSGRLGLILSDKPERTTIDISGTKYLPIGRGTESRQGPDIGAVLLLTHDVGTALEARKSFCNLDFHRHRLLSAPPDNQEGIWVAQGFVEEMTILDPNPSPYERVKGFCQFGAVGGVVDYIESGGYDYYTFPQTRSPSEGIPKNFGGCSGGGLWHVRLMETKEGDLAIIDSLLQGMSYWQEPPIEGLSALKCHGPKSIYDVAYSAIGQTHPGNT